MIRSLAISSQIAAAGLIFAAAYYAGQAPTLARQAAGMSHSTVEAQP